MPLDRVSYTRLNPGSFHRWHVILPPFLHDHNFHRAHSAVNALPASRLPKTADNLSLINSQAFRLVERKAESLWSSPA